MLYALHLSTTPTRSWVSHAVFSQTEPPRRVDCLFSLWDYGRKVSFPRTHRYIACGVDNLVDANYRSHKYTTTANWDISNKCFAQCGH